MRERRARWAIVGLMLALPMLMVCASPRLGTVREAVVPVIAVEAILVAGLAGVAAERRRLLEEIANPAPRVRREAHHVGAALVGRS